MKLYIYHRLVITLFLTFLDIFGLTFITFLRILSFYYIIITNKYPIFIVVYL